MSRCSGCGQPVPAIPGPCPPEPPVGTWVRNRQGRASVRVNEGWAPAEFGFFGAGSWEAMWAAHGPLVKCGPHGVGLDGSIEFDDGVSPSVGR